MSLRFAHSATLMCSKPVALPVLCGWRCSNNCFRPSAENSVPFFRVNDTRFTILCIHIKDWSVRESQNDKPKDLQVEKIQRPWSLDNQKNTTCAFPIPVCHTINKMVLFIENIVSVDERLESDQRNRASNNHMTCTFCSSKIVRVLLEILYKYPQKCLVCYCDIINFKKLSIKNVLP